MDDTPIPGFRYLVTNPERLGGKPTIRGTRLSASFILAYLAEGMSYEDIVREYSAFPRDSLAEVLRFAAAVTDRNDVAAGRQPPHRPHPTPPRLRHRRRDAGPTGLAGNDINAPASG